jgi:hypothetical protein
MKTALQIQGTAAAPIHQPETPPEQPSRRFAEFVQRHGDRGSEALIWTGLATLIAGAALFAAIKTWQSWQKDMTIVEVDQWGHNYTVSTIQHVNADEAFIGYFPMFTGLVAAGIAARWTLDDHPEPGFRRRALVAGSCGLFILVVAYGACLSGLHGALYRKSWDLGSTYQWHLDDKLFARLTKASIALMAFGGAGLISGAASRIALNRRKGEER